VEDSALVRHGIRAALKSEPAGGSVEIVGEADTASAALIKAQRLRPDVVLLDLRLPDDSGVNVCRQLRQLLSDTCVLILTSSTDNALIYETVLAGAHGYLLKEIDPANLIKAIKDGHAGQPVFSGAITTSILNTIRDQHAKPDVPSGVELLSPQELRVLAAISEGHSNKEIADLMGLSANTVKHYISNLFQKLGVERRAQATALYLTHRPARQH
jgi:DNA-binding NarL/FixJ family response regulator